MGCIPLLLQVSSYCLSDQQLCKSQLSDRFYWINLAVSIQYLMYRGKILKALRDLGVSVPLIISGTLTLWGVECFWKWDVVFWVTYRLLKMLPCLATAQSSTRWSQCCQSQQRGQGWSGSQWLLPYEALLFLSAQQSLLLSADTLVGNEVVEKYRFQWRNRNRETCLEKAPVIPLHFN